MGKGDPKKSRISDEHVDSPPEHQPSNSGTSEAVGARHSTSATGKRRLRSEKSDAEPKHEAVSADGRGRGGAKQSTAGSGKKSRTSSSRLTTREKLARGDRLLWALSVRKTHTSDKPAQVRVQTVEGSAASTSLDIKCEKVKVISRLKGKELPWLEVKYVKADDDSNDWQRMELDWPETSTAVSGPAWIPFRAGESKFVFRPSCNPLENLSKLKGWDPSAEGEAILLDHEGHHCEPVCAASREKSDVRARDSDRASSAASNTDAGESLSSRNSGADSESSSSRKESRQKAAGSARSAAEEDSDASQQLGSPTVERGDFVTKSVTPPLELEPISKFSRNKIGDIIDEKLGFKVMLDREELVDAFEECCRECQEAISWAHFTSLYARCLMLTDRADDLAGDDKVKEKVIHVITGEDKETDGYTFAEVPIELPKNMKASKELGSKPIDIFRTQLLLRYGIPKHIQTEQVPPAGKAQIKVLKEKTGSVPEPTAKQGTGADRTVGLADKAAMEVASNAKAPHDEPDEKAVLAACTSSRETIEGGQPSPSTVISRTSSKDKGEVMPSNREVPQSSDKTAGKRKPASYSKAVLPEKGHKFPRQDTVNASQNEAFKHLLASQGLTALAQSGAQHVSQPTMQLQAPLMGLVPAQPANLGPPVGFMGFAGPSSSISAPLSGDAAHFPVWSEADYEARKRQYQQIQESLAAELKAQAQRQIALEMAKEQILASIRTEREKHMEQILQENKERRDQIEKMNNDHSAFMKSRGISSSNDTLKSLSNTQLAALDEDLTKLIEKVQKETAQKEQVATLTQDTQIQQHALALSQMQQQFHRVYHYHEEVLKAMRKQLDKASPDLLLVSKALTSLANPAGQPTSSQTPSNPSASQPAAAIRPAHPVCDFTAQELQAKLFSMLSS